MFGELKSATGNIEGYARPNERAISADGGNKIVTAGIQQGFFGQCARRDDTYDLSVNGSFAGGGIAYLLADGNGGRPVGPVWRGRCLPREREHRT